jgi:hypothetical protein
MSFLPVPGGWRMNNGIDRDFFATKIAKITYKGRKNEIKEKPILFSTPTVKAILEGRKTMTRRVVEPQPVLDGDGFWQWKDCQWHDGGIGCPQSGIDDYSPYRPGDILWVRETWGEKDDYYYYRADEDFDTPILRWKPSIFMPREAARLFLEVKAVRIERLQDITEEDSKAEGVERKLIQYKGAFVGFTTYKQSFSMLWDRLNAKSKHVDAEKKPVCSWESNPWVWVCKFERVKQ